MSWDVAIVKINGTFRPIDEVESSDFISMGTHAEVVEAIRQAFPEAQWSEDELSALFDGAEFSIEFDLAPLEESQSIILQVRGGSDPISAILKLTNTQNWVAVDCSLGSFIDPENPSAEGWEGYRELADSE